MIQDQLNHEKVVNAKELEGLEDLHAKLKEDLITVNVQHNEKLQELESIRIRANEEIKRLASTRS